MEKLRFKNLTVNTAWYHFIPVKRRICSENNYVVLINKLVKLVLFSKNCILKIKEKCFLFIIGNVTKQIRANIACENCVWVESVTHAGSPHQFLISFIHTSLPANHWEHQQVIWTLVCQKDFSKLLQSSLSESWLVKGLNLVLWGLGETSIGLAKNISTHIWKESFWTNERLNPTTALEPLLNPLARLLTLDCSLLILCWDWITLFQF